MFYLQDLVPRQRLRGPQGVLRGGQDPGMPDGRRRSRQVSLYGRGGNDLARPNLPSFVQRRPPAHPRESGGLLFGRYPRAHQSGTRYPSVPTSFVPF